jgi:hypothetical protein
MLLRFRAKITQCLVFLGVRLGLGLGSLFDGPQTSCEMPYLLYHLRHAHLRRPNFGVFYMLS